MNLLIKRYALVWLLILYWSLSFLNDYLLATVPYTAEIWQELRLKIILIAVSASITLLIYFRCNNSKSNQGEWFIAIMVVAILHLLLLFLPCLYLFYLWQWDGELLLNWQGAGFTIGLIAIPLATLIGFM
ncbi:hypothetical protein RYR42_002909 [Edwardsiella piscicida]|nr:hypothetical protein [Edwardsiella piscicida]